MTVCSRPSSNRACYFPAHGFPSVVRRWPAPPGRSWSRRFWRSCGVHIRLPGHHHSSASLLSIDTSALPWLPVRYHVPQINATMEDSDFSSHRWGLAGPARLCRGLRTLRRAAHGWRSPSLSWCHFLLRAESPASARTCLRSSSFAGSRSEGSGGRSGQLRRQWGTRRWRRRFAISRQRAKGCRVRSMP